MSGLKNRLFQITITLERDERGFGFSIRGGKAFQEEDTLFVLRIGKGGVADRDGRLRRGDEIIEINGQSMYEVTESFYHYFHLLIFILWFFSSIYLHHNETTFEYFTTVKPPIFSNF